MKNCAKYLILFAFISWGSFGYCDEKEVPIGYLHDKILEKTVPELKEFNNKLTGIFRIKDPKVKVKAIKDLFSFFQRVKVTLSNEMMVSKMTPAEIKAVKIVLGIMKRKLASFRAEVG